MCTYMCVTHTHAHAHTCTHTHTHTHIPTHSLVCACMSVGVSFVGSEMGGTSAWLVSLDWASATLTRLSHFKLGFTLQESHL